MDEVRSVSVIYIIFKDYTYTMIVLQLFHHKKKKKEASIKLRIGETGILFNTLDIIKEQVEKQLKTNYELGRF